jgi:hypothetical protein
MKRAGFLVLAIAIASGLVAPLGIALEGRSVEVSTHMAQAAPKETPPPPIVKTGDCVKIALPIFTKGGNCVNNSEKGGGAIISYLKQVLALLAAAVGIVIVLMLVIAGIQYITSVGDPGAIKDAKNKIVNAITALVLFLMMYAILNFLIPGGVL